ncbi:hypothetical protein VCR14J2_410376 [Vibrio coralliirubri]|uniref:Uncharacterized protein n=1 Tax=Vibrio coralliirubri TaxID=1516159 RepID=A0AA86XRQ5_9VIBR|nr:hypothetical protein VCR1J2_200520 [Vibrio coralliirubri]CDT15252.1 hypothetical protein VCR6J2_230400 [Vibrio coralliirubri]CDT31525.1 hypothetical protein VCR15J2_20415 [Vibrio coralliirubri]CDT53578.1 hypothetical protein VCR29J2_360339 [Vibrio coralliirubri]CDT78061.1 hypothetical protein VCR31J2_1310537 [Vibrio coralliirubri]
MLRDRLRIAIDAINTNRIRISLEPVIRFMLFIKAAPQIENEVIL